MVVNIPEDKTVLHEAGYIVNDLIHNEIEKHSYNKSDDISLFSINTQLQSVNPLLLEFMKSITTTVCEHKHPSLASESANSKHIKDIRIYFALCLLQYCTNPSQPTPFHNLISDAVEVCGGSRQLLQILNRLGCTSSPDTHD